MIRRDNGPAMPGRRSSSAAVAVLISTFVGGDGDAAAPGAPLPSGEPPRPTLAALDIASRPTMTTTPATQARRVTTPLAQDASSDVARHGPVSTAAPAVERKMGSSRTTD